MPLSDAQILLYRAFFVGIEQSSVDEMIPLIKDHNVSLNALQGLAPDMDRVRNVVKGIPGFGGEHGIWTETFMQNFETRLKPGETKDLPVLQSEVVAAALASQLRGDTRAEFEMAIAEAVQKGMLKAEELEPSSEIAKALWKLPEDSSGEGGRDRSCLGRKRRVCS